MKIFLVSNMYPSKVDKLYGVFVKNFKVELEKQNVIFAATAFIKGRTNSIIKKAANYATHYFKIAFHSLFSKFDILYVHYVSHHVPILLLLLPFKRNKWVLNAHGNDIMALQKHNFLNSMSIKILKKVDLLVVPTSYFKKKILEYYPFIPDEKIFVSPSGGINSSNFYVQVDKEENSQLKLGFVSRFIEEKGWRTFIDSLSYLDDKNLEFSATIAGKGPDGEKIKQYITEKNLSHKIQFRGFVPQEELVTLYNQLDLYIFPTYREAESLGLTGLEAMASGTPVIACNIAGPSTYIEHGKNGFLFTPKDHEKLAEIILDYTKLSLAEKNVLKQNAVNTAARFEQSLVGKLLVKRLEALI